MKTKKVILLFALLMSGIIVSAQPYSEDNGKMKTRHDQTSKPHIQISSQDVITPDYITSFGTWWQLLKIYVVPGIGIDNGNDDGTNNKDIYIQNKDRRTLPRLPGPHRYRATQSTGNMDRR